MVTSVLMSNVLNLRFSSLPKLLLCPTEFKRILALPFLPKNNSYNNCNSNNNNSNNKNNNSNSNSNSNSNNSSDEVDACWNDCLAPPPAAEVRQAVEEAMIAAAVGETEEEAAVEVAPEEWVSVEGDGDLDGCVVDLGSLSAPLSRHGTTPRLPSTPPSATPPAVAGAAVPGAEEAEWDLLSLGGSEECTKKAALSEETEDWEAASEAASEAVSEALENRSFADTEAWETESELGATVDPDEGASGTSGTEDGHGTAMAAAVASCVLEPVSEGEACSSWAARLRAPAAAPPPARARRASNNAATALAGAAAKGGRWKPSEQLPKGTKPPPKRLVPRWGEVAFAYS